MGVIKKNWVEVIVFAISLLVYSFSSSRSIIHGDTGEFLSVAAFHGVAHPPGFPLYSLIISLVFLIFKNIWIVTFLSAVFASASLVFVYKAVHLITKNKIPSLLASLSLAFFETFWFYAQVAQIHDFFVFVESVFLYFLVLTVKKKSVKLLYLTFFIFGLGFSSHQAMVFAVPALVYILFIFKKDLDIKKIIYLVIFSALGLLPYLYIAVVAPTNPPVNWGLVHDFNSLLAVFFRRDYGYFLLSKSEAGAPFVYSTFIHYFKNVIYTGWYLLPLFFISLYGVYKKNVYYILFFLLFIFAGPAFYLLMNVPVRTIVHQATIEQYIPYSYIFLSVLFGLGLQILFKRFKSKYVFSASLTIFLVIIFSSYFTFQKVRLDNNNFVDITIKFIFSEIPKNGVILTWSDSLYLPSLYEQLLKEDRPDITIIQVGTVNLDWYPKYLKQYHPDFAKYVVNKQFQYKKICDDLAGSGRLFVYPYFSDFADVFKNDCAIIPIGLADEVVPSRDTQNVSEIKKINDASIRKYAAEVNLQNYKNKSVRTREGLYYIGEQLNFVGLYYMFNQKDDWALEEFELARNISPDEISALISESAVLYKRGEYQKAISVLEDAKKRNPAIPDTYKNLGLIYEKIGDLDNTVLNLKTYLDFDPQDPQIPALQNKINMYGKTGSSLLTQ